jgi:hypothetical protein
MAVLLEPLVRLHPLAGALTWFALKVAFALVSLYWIFRLVELPDRPFPVWAKVLATLLALKPIVDDLNHGNVNLFILFLVIAALAAYRIRRDVLAGAVMGLAIACKVTPALFVPYFVWKRAWGAVAGCVLGLGLFLYPGVIPALRLGWDDNQRQLASWYRGMVHPFVVEGKVTSEHHNQSIPGLVARLATHSPSFSTYVNDVYTPTRYDNLLELSQDQTRWLVKGCLGLFALVIVWTCRTPARERQGWPLAAECGLIVLGMLLFSERTWKHHAVTLALPFAVLAYALAQQREFGWRAYLTGTLVAVVALMSVTSFSPSGVRADPERFAQSLGKQAQVYGAYVIAYLLLAAALAALLRKEAVSRASSPRQGVSPAERDTQANAA